MSRENLEGRFWYNGEKPYLWIIAAQMPNVSADDFNIVHIPRNSSVDDIVHALNTHPVDAVYLDAPGSAGYDSDLLRALIAIGAVIYLRDRPDGVKCWALHKFGRRIYTLGGVNKDRAWEITKRTMDVPIALAGAAAACAVYPILAPIIRAQSGGSAIFTQNRVGYNGRSFKLYKFRSMRSDAEDTVSALTYQNEMNAYMFKMADDPRITPIGKVMRRLSVDELPQFFNVLKGEMSVVGTRPPIDREVENYHAHHKIRLSTKPGITGMWQTHGRNKVTDFEQVVAMDREYIQHPSPNAYLYIVALTIFNALTGGDGE